MSARSPRPSPRPSNSPRARGALALGVLVLVLGARVPGRAEELGVVHFYSTAAPPRDYPGPRPSPWGRRDPAVLPVAGDPAAAAPENGAIGPEPRAPAPSITRVATAPSEALGGRPETELDLTPRSGPHQPAGSAEAISPGNGPASPASEAVEDPMVRARRMIGSCKARYEQQVHDYTCTFFKRERLDGRLQGYHVIHMKIKARPLSVYAKFVRPNAGREAIWIAGRNDGQAVVHDVGIGKLIAGTVNLDPHGRRAMEGNRHPISDVGIGHLIDTLAERWGLEMRPGETQVRIVPGVKVGDRVCTLIESTHPRKSPAYLFHSVKVFIDQELNLPIRFEAYDWPHRPGGAPELVEEYTYSNLRVNAGLTDRDFDPSNERYSFGRF